MTRNVHCSSCGLILGRNASTDLHSCPRCGRVLRVLAFATDEDGRDRPEYVPVDPGRKRFVALYVGEAMLRFLLAPRSPRAREWEDFVIELEEERLKAFAHDMGWVIADLMRDPGPVVGESKRPFERLEKDLGEGVVNTVLVTDFARVTRQDLRRMHASAQAHGTHVLAIAPHTGDPNLFHDNIDYDAVPLAEAERPALERLWNEEAERKLRQLLEKAGWHWTQYGADLLAPVLGMEGVRAWRNGDPACRAQPWKEVFTRWLIARARREGTLTTALPLPRLESCRLCRRRFVNASLSVRFMEVTAGRTEYCGTCLGVAFHDAEDRQSFVGPPEVDSMADADQGTAFFRELPAERFHEFLQAVNRKISEVERRGPAEPPSNAWLGALLEVGLLKGFGEVIRADAFYKGADGHLSQSLGAALIDNWLAERHLRHRPDARYPTATGGGAVPTARADLVVGDVLVEFMGLRGRDEMSKDIAQRVAMARAAGARLIAIYADDLPVTEVINRKLAPLLELAETE